MSKTISTAILTLAIVISACTGGSPEAVPTPGGGGLGGFGNGSGNGIRTLRSLVAFDDCDALVDHVKAEARERVGPYGLDWDVPRPWFGWDTIATDAELAAPGRGFVGTEPAPPPASGRAAQSGVDDGDSSGGSGFVGTNVQERGVDEPDIVKTDGRLILVVSGTRLTAVDAATLEVTDVLSLPEGWSHELFFDGDTAMLFTNTGYWGDPMPMPVEPLAGDGATSDAARMIVPPDSWVGPAALVTSVDLSNPTDLRISGTLRIEGEYLSARLVDGAVRLAVSSGPAQLPWVYPGGPGSEERAREMNRQIVEDSTLSDWLPDFELTVGSDTSEGLLVDCADLHRPTEFSGFDVVTVLSLDIAGGLGRGDGTAVLASGRTVYSSTDWFYVATTDWGSVPIPVDAEPRSSDTVEPPAVDDFSTAVHAFATPAGSPARYVASGEVPGSLLNQFSMDEHDGYLRVVTTTGSPWGSGSESESILTVLQVDGDRLVETGSLAGLGKGESLYSARLLDDIGFAVTFKRVDPLFVIDLSDPSRPTVSGELKIPGFSTYLHPLPGDRILGIGQDATLEGATTGFKVSLFDVSDPGEPREVATWVSEGAASLAEHDHRAFQMIGDIAVLPLRSWADGFNGAVLLEVGAGSITEVGRISHTIVTDPGDCRILDASDIEGESEITWILREGGQVLVCPEDPAAGPTRPSCESIGFDELKYWGVEESPEELREYLDDPDAARIEICWPDDGWSAQIARSLATGDLLWTLSEGSLQANRLDDLGTETVIPLR